MGIDTYPFIFYFGGENWKLRRRDWRNKGRYCLLFWFLQKKCPFLQVKPGFCFNHGRKHFSYQSKWRTGLEPSAALHTCPLHCKELSSPLICFSFFCSFLCSFLDQHRMAELMQPRTLCRSCFILIIPQVFMKGLPCAGTVPGAGNTAVNKADRSPFCH